MPAPVPNRDQHILDAAARLFIHYGYDKTTMDDIAREAGVAKGTLYLYWPSKDALFEALFFRELCRVNLDFLARVEADPRGGTIGTVLRHGLDAAYANPFVRALMTTQGRAVGTYLRRAGPALSRLMFRLDESLVRRLQEVGVIRSDLTPSLATYLLSTLSMGVTAAAEFFADETRPPPDVLAPALADLVERAFAPPGGGNAEGGKAVLREYIHEVNAALMDYVERHQREEKRRARRSTSD